LITHPILFFWPRLTTIYFLDWKNKTIESSPFFAQHGGHCSRGNLAGRTIYWLFWVTCTS
jgi:hypothetical protein